MKTILLYSGGLDSSLIYEVYNKKIDEVIYIDYGQENIEKELSVVNEHCDHVKKLTIPPLKQKDNFFYARNLKFLIKLMDTYEEDLVVYLGTCADDEFSDNNKRFFTKASKVLRDSYPHKIKIKLPLIKMNKKHIQDKYKSLCDKAIWYCDTGEDKPCGKCHSCKTMAKYKL